MVAGTHSGVGKTTIATGLMAALGRRGHRVGGAKIGPDFIDPAYHRLATGRPSRSLDAFLSGPELLPALAAKAGEGCDVLVVEGVMGLFDGAAVPGVDGSTAAVARALRAPVVLVVDASAMSGSVAAVVHGFASLDPAVEVAGVVLNRVGSEGHGALLREALAPLGIPVLGTVLHDDRLTWRERHLGLVPVVEQPEVVGRSLVRLAEVVASSIDLQAVMGLAAGAPRRRVGEPPQAREVGRCRIAVCSGPAFSFVYPENLELFSQAGAELVGFDPLTEPALPAGCQALYAGGGFPEVYATALSENRPLLTDVRGKLSHGMTAWAECGGLVWLAASVDGVPMAGVLDQVQVQMGARLTLGYCHATTRQPSFLGPAGTVVRGHEFHRTTADPAGDGLHLVGRFGATRAGHLSPSLVASYLHQHLSARPELAERFVTAGRGHRAGG